MVDALTSCRRRIDTTQDVIVKVMSFKDDLMAQPSQFCYAEVRALLGKTWSPEKWDGAFW